MATGKIWAFGHAGKKGMVIVSNQGNTIRVKATAAGKMYAPDPIDFQQKFLAELNPQDIVLGVSATHRTFFEVCYRVGTHVWWMHATTLKHLLDKDKSLKMPHALINLWHQACVKKCEPDATPEHFYEYLAAAEGIDELRIGVDEWKALEKLVTADTNKLSQLLQRQRMYYLLNPAKLGGFISRFAEAVADRFASQLSRWCGGKLAKHEQQVLGHAVQEQTAELYKRYFSPDAQQAKQDRLRWIEDRLNFFGCSVQLEHAQNEVERLLKALPENKLFDGLVSAGATRIRGFLLALMADPRRFPNVNALIAYAGVNARDGQRIQKRSGGKTNWNHEFRKYVGYDAPSTLYKNDAVGTMKRLYQVYKPHQYLVYWELMELTKQVYGCLGMSDQDVDPEVDDTNGEEEIVIVPTRHKAALSLVEIVDRLGKLSDLPIIARNETIKRIIASLRDTPDPQVLRTLFSRTGLNLQMTPKRIEQQAWSMIGTVLLKAIYYRWLEHLDLPLPLEQDHVYKTQYRHFMGSADGLDYYDPEVVVAFYEKRVLELRDERLMYGSPLPVEIEFKLTPPVERLAFLQSASQKDRTAIWKMLTAQDRKRYAEAFPEQQTADVGV